MTVETIEAVETVETVERVEMVETVEAVGTVEVVETVETPEMAEPVGSWSKGSQLGVAAEPVGELELSRASRGVEDLGLRPSQQGGLRFFDHLIIFPHLFESKKTRIEILRRSVQFSARELRSETISCIFG